MLKQMRLFYKLTNGYSNIFDNADCIVGYEASMAMLAKSIAKKYNVKYINKYQGTILAATNRNKIKAILYYPKLYWGINNSDLCLMVNDGTDGEYWANLRGCKKIRFRPHGVSISDYEENVSTVNEDDFFVIFNNASSSQWKRPDRIIRAINQLPDNLKKKIKLKTTYFGPDKQSLIKYVKELNLEHNVEFLSGLDHVQCNKVLRESQLLIMTNDMSNLGNPILEAIYYDIPFITIDDGSVSPFVNDSPAKAFVNISDDMDLQMAEKITYFLKNETVDLNKNNNMIKSLNEEQIDEFEYINNVCTNKV